MCDALQNQLQSDFLSGDHKSQSLRNEDQKQQSQKNSGLSTMLNLEFKSGQIFLEENFTPQSSSRSHRDKNISQEMQKLNTYYHDEDELIQSDTVQDTVSKIFGSNRMISNHKNEKPQNLEQVQSVKLQDSINSVNSTKSPISKAQNLGFSQLSKSVNKFKSLSKAGQLTARTSSQLNYQTNPLRSSSRSPLNKSIHSNKSNNSQQSLRIKAQPDTHYYSTQTKINTQPQTSSSTTFKYSDKIQKLQQQLESQFYSNISQNSLQNSSTPGASTKFSNLITKQKVPQQKEVFDVSQTELQQKRQIVSKQQQTRQNSVSNERKLNKSHSKLPQQLQAKQQTSVAQDQESQMFLEKIREQIQNLIQTGKTLTIDEITQLSDQILTVMSVFKDPRKKQASNQYVDEINYLKDQIQDYQTQMSSQKKIFDKVKYSLEHQIQKHKDTLLKIQDQQKLYVEDLRTKFLQSFQSKFEELTLLKDRELSSLRDQNHKEMVVFRDQCEKSVQEMIQKIANIQENQSELERVTIRLLEEFRLRHICGSFAHTVETKRH
eukprot:403336886